MSNVRVLPIRLNHLARRQLVAAGIVFASLLVAGCNDEPDDRIAEFALEASRRQAEHNKLVTEAHRDLTHGSQVLVSADSVARQDLVTLQRELHEDLATIGQQRDVLEAERVQSAQQRRLDSLLGNVLFGTAILLACLSPLVLAALALWHRETPLTPAELQVALLEEVAAARITTEQVTPTDLLALDEQSPRRLQ